MDAVRWGAMVVLGLAVKGQKASLTETCAIVTGCAPSFCNRNTIVPGQRTVCTTLSDSDGAGGGCDSAGGASQLLATRPTTTPISRQKAASTPRELRQRTRCSHRKGVIVAIVTPP